MVLNIHLERPDHKIVAVPLRATNHSDAFSFTDDTVVFKLPENESVYLTSKENVNFNTPPVLKHLMLQPNSSYLLSGEAFLEGGQATLWLIEYDEQIRRCHQTCRLQSGRFELAWTSHPRHKSACLAIRLAGQGRLLVNRLQLSMLPRPPVSESEQHEVSQRQAFSMADAQMTTGPGLRGDFGIGGGGIEAFSKLLDEHDIGPALVMPCGSNPVLDTFDQICELANQQPNRVCPLFRWHGLGELTGKDLKYYLDQLELLWQSGRLYGLVHDLSQENPPRPEILDWLDRRSALTFWEVRSQSDLDWLEKKVLSRFAFPVLIAPVSELMDSVEYQTLITDLLSKYVQSHVIIDAAQAAARILSVVGVHASQVLVGSDTPYGNADPSELRFAIEKLDIRPFSKELLLVGNLCRLIDNVESARFEALQSRHGLMFPPLPRDSDDLARQGFEIVAADQLTHEEAQEAKETWAQWEVKSWYQQDKPWARLLAKLVQDLGAERVLEFGCNVGRNLATIAKAVPDAQLVGIDVNPRAIQAGREHTGLDLRIGDETSLHKFDEGEFDLVFTVSVLDHIPDISSVCEQLLRCAARNFFCLEITLPSEGKVLRHFDHKHNAVMPSTEASYSWDVGRFLVGHRRLWRLDRRPCYLHSASLGPYYYSYLAFLEPPR